MSATPDRRQIALRDVEVQIGNTGANTVVSNVGGMRYNGSVFQLLDAQGQYDPRTGYRLDHGQLNDLIHVMGEGGPVLHGAYKTTTYAPNTPFVLSETWWTSSAQTLPVSKHTFAYPTGSYVTPLSETWTVYVPGTATVAHTVTDTFAYTTVFEVARTRTYT